MIARESIIKRRGAQHPRRLSVSATFSECAGERDARFGMGDDKKRVAKWLCAQRWLRCVFDG